MLRGPTWRAAEIAGTAVFRMVVSSDSMKKATATSHGRSRLLASERVDDVAGTTGELDAFIGYLQEQRADEVHTSPGLIRYVCLVLPVRCRYLSIGYV
jgi:hypothetical protein